MTRIKPRSADVLFIALMITLGLTACDSDTPQNADADAVEERDLEDVAEDTTSEVTEDMDAGDSDDFDPECPPPLTPEQCAAPPGIFALGGDEIRFVPPPPGFTSRGAIYVANGSTEETSLIRILELELSADASPYIALPANFTTAILGPEQGGFLTLSFTPPSADYACPEDPSDPDYCGELLIHHNDEANSPVSVPIRVDKTTGQLGITPEIVQFEDNGADQEQTLTLSNVGAGPLTVLSVDMAPMLVEIDFVEPQPAPFTLEVGEEASYTVSYFPDPSDPGPLTTLIRVANSSPISTRTVLVEVGQTQDPRITLEPLWLDLVGATAERPVSDTLTITNIGAGSTLQVNVALGTDAPADNFAVTLPDGESALENPVIVMRQESVQLTVTHQPLDGAAIDDATLFLSTNDPLQPSLEVSIRAR